MPMTTLRLTVLEKRRFLTEARQRGLSLSEYLRESALAATQRGNWKKFLEENPAVTLPKGAATDLSSREGFAR